MRRIITIIISFLLLSCNGQKKEEKIIEGDKKNSNVQNQQKKIAVDNLVPLAKINCQQENSDLPNYLINCKNFNVSNSIIEASDKNRYELITFVFHDIEKAIIRKINNEDLETSPPIVFSSKTDKNYIIFFPINGDSHFGWKLYFYKNKVLYPLGQRVMYWKPEYEESDLNYSNILNIYESDNNVIVEIPIKYVVENDNDYKNYPDYLDGKYSKKGDKVYYEFSTLKMEYYKKYKNGLFEGDYNKMINNKIIDLIK